MSIDTRMAASAYFRSLLLWQTFREPPDVPAEELLPRLRDCVGDALAVAGDGDEAASRLQVMWSDRRRRRPAGCSLPPPPPLSPDHAASELGLRFRVGIPAPGKDPSLYLDFRAARRWLRSHSRDRDVLNVFAYTCGASVAALAGGAHIPSHPITSHFSLAQRSQLPLPRRVPCAHAGAIQPLRHTLTGGLATQHSPALCPLAIYGRCARGGVSRLFTQCPRCGQR